MELIARFGVRVPVASMRDLDALYRLGARRRKTVPVPILVAGGIGVAVGLITAWVLHDRQEPEPSSTRSDPKARLEGCSTPPQCLKIALMVWRRASKQQAHELICALTGTRARQGLKAHSTPPQVHAIAKLLWYRASKQEAHKLIGALESLPETPRPRLEPSLDPIFLEERVGCD